MSDFVVAGLGPSVRDFCSRAHRYATIGVNDVGRWFTPDHLLVLDGPGSFVDERARVIRRTRPRRAVWFHNSWPGWTDLPHADLVFQRVVATRLLHSTLRSSLDSLRAPGALNGVLRLPQFRTSPFCAVSLAYALGANRIGLIGVDFVSHHFRQTLGEIQTRFEMLRLALAERGVQLVNLSRASLLTSLPVMPWRFIRPVENLGAKADDRMFHETTPRIRKHE